METLEIINKFTKFCKESQLGDPLDVLLENAGELMSISIELSNYLDDLVGYNSFRAIGELDPNLAVLTIAIHKARSEGLETEEYPEFIETEVMKLTKAIQDLREDDSEHDDSEHDDSEHDDSEHDEDSGNLPTIEDNYGAIFEKDEEDLIIEEAFQNDEVIPAYSVTYVKPVAKDVDGNWIFETDEGLSYLEDHFFKL